MLRSKITLALLIITTVRNKYSEKQIELKTWEDAVHTEDGGSPRYVHVRVFLVRPVFLVTGDTTKLILCGN